MTRTATSVAEASNARLAMIEDHLALGARYIAENEALIFRQKAAIAEQARTGRDTTQASRVLRNMRDTLAVMHGHREILLHERERTIQNRTPLPHKP